MRRHFGRDPGPACAAVRPNDRGYRWQQKETASLILRWPEQSFLIAVRLFRPRFLRSQR